MKYFALFLIFLSTSAFAFDIPGRPDQRPFDITSTKYELVSKYGPRIRNGYKREHTGIDYSLYLDTPILASGDGEIIFSRFCGNYGNLIIIRHDWIAPNGDKKTAFTYYAHLVEFQKLKGTKVKKGEVIGLAGMTGDADGAHVHFEVRNENKYPIWPGEYMAERNLEIKAEQEANRVANSRI